MASTRKTQPKTVGFLDLTVWKTKLPDCQFAVLPASNTRPNPLATQDRLYASVFAPGAICALERGDGKLIWRRELPKYSGASVYLYERKLFAKTSNTLFALNPDSGETFWSFCPYGTDGESIYSSPSAQQNRVFIGDRRGYLHCLDADSGKTIWRNLTNRAGGNVNSTPLVVRDLVIVSTNAKTAVAYEAVSGKLAWEQGLDGPSVFEPVLHKRSVLVVSGSLYVLNPTSGKIQLRLFWRDSKVQQAASTPQSIIVMLRPEIPHTEISATHVEEITATAAELGSKTAMCFIATSGTKRKRQIAAFCPQFRYEASTRLVYLSHLGGVDILRPTTGAPVCQLTTNSDTRGGTGLVDVTDGTIYVLTGDGTVHALRHPAQSPTVSH
jgi:outer membrane protein assembly factor BamB